jgi:hypothetical protein
MGDRNLPPRPKRTREELEEQLEAINQELEAERERREAAERENAAERERREAAERQNAAAQERQEAAERQNAAERERREAAERQNAAAQERRAGTYYATYDEFWDIFETPIPLSLKATDSLAAIRRESMPTMYETAFSEENLRKDLAKSEVVGRSENTDPSNSSSSGVKSDMFGNRTFEKSHLIPNAIVGSRAYGFVAEAALGLKNTKKDRRLKLVNGVEEEKADGKIRRVEQSGLKHNKYNKLRLKMQANFFDSAPFVLVIPILSLKQVLGWDETTTTDAASLRDNSYDVMICASGEKAKECYKEILGDYFGEGTQCTKGEIRTATQLLSTFAKALATSTFNDEVMESMTDQNKRSTVVATILRRIEEARSAGHANVMLPIVNNEVLGPNMNFRVAKARVSKTTSLPDPYLVAVKAAANWFASQEQRMMPTSSDYALDSSDSDSGYNDDWSPQQACPHETLAKAQSVPGYVSIELFSGD